MSGIGILAILLALGVWTAGVGLKSYEFGSDAKAKELAPKIAGLETKAATVTTENASFAINESTYKDQIKACNLRADAAKADSEIAAAMQAKTQKDAEARAATFQQQLARFAAAAQQSTAPDQQCDAVKKVILDAGTTMTALDALGLGAKTVTTPLPSQPTLTITPAPTKAPPKSAIKTLGTK
jgi:hypothetical protein